MDSIVVDGLEKLALTKSEQPKLLREQLGYSLADAKRVVDEIMDNHEVRLLVASGSVADFTCRLRELGAVVKAKS